MPVRKSKNQLRDDLRKRINTAGDYFIDKQPADVGNYAGVVKVPNTQSMIYVRVANGQVVQVFNDKAPAIYNWKVYIGRDKSQPSLLKVLEVRWIYNLAQTVAYVLFHHEQHEYPAPDTVWIRRDQFMPLLVLPAGGFKFNMYGDTIYRTGMTAPIRVADAENVDLVAYSGGLGAFYVLLEITPTGTLNYVEGTNYGSLAALYLNPLPAPTGGNFPVCAFIFYEGQTELRRDSVERTIIDLRMFTSDVSAILYLDDLLDVDTPSPTNGQVLTWDDYASAWIASDSSSGGAQYIDELLDVDAPAPVDGQVLTYSAYAGVWIASDPVAGSGTTLKLVMRPDVSSPPESVQNVDGTDWVYYEV